MVETHDFDAAAPPRRRRPGAGAVSRPIRRRGRIDRSVHRHVRLPGPHRHPIRPGPRRQSQLDDRDAGRLGQPGDATGHPDLRRGVRRGPADRRVQHDHPPRLAGRRGGTDQARSRGGSVHRVARPERAGPRRRRRTIRSHGSVRRPDGPPVGSSPSNEPATDASRSSPAGGRTCASRTGATRTSSPPSASDRPAKRVRPCRGARPIRSVGR